MNQFARTTGGFQWHACTLIREETRDVYSDRRPIQWITINLIKRHVCVIEMYVIRRFSAMFVRKFSRASNRLISPLEFLCQSFNWKMFSSMKVALSTWSKQLVSSIVISHCVLPCVLAGVPRILARQGQKISFSIHQLNSCKTKARHCLVTAIFSSGLRAIFA